MDYPANIRNLIQQFSKLPTIGPKTAERIVLYLLSKNDGELDVFSLAIQEIKGRIKRCAECFNFSETNPCSVCSDSRRDHTMVCVVAKPQDIYAIEKTKNYSGVYFVLGGCVNPIEGVTLDTLNIKPLEQLIVKNKVSELILAFNPDVEGETTILTLQKYFEKNGMKITRLARGLPMGSDIEYADEITLGDALKGRKIL